MLRILSGIILLLIGYAAQAEVINVPLSVWANRSIVEVYSYDYDNIVQRQKHTAKFFTSQAWLNFSQAQLNSGVIEAVKKNYYRVRSVATQAPKITDRGVKDNFQRFVVVMPILVTYTNPQYQQKQHLVVTLSVVAPSGTDNFEIESFVSKVKSKQQCQVQELEATIIKPKPTSDKKKK